MSELKPTHPFIERSGRWSRSPFDTLTASWCSASIRFLFSGRLLRIRPGKNTERKDPENGGTPMLVWTITPEGTDSSEPLVVESGDAHPFREITLIEDGHVTLVDRPCFVQITLVDWASVFEVEAIVVESAECLRPLSSSESPPKKVLLIGDSISCGYTVSTRETGHPTRGYYDAFPAIAHRHLRDQKDSSTLQIDTVAYPGITLVNPTESEAEEGMARGMVDRFFHSSPWDTIPLTEYDHPSMVIIALGTNDEACNVSVERFEAALDDFMKRLLQLFRMSLKHLFVIHPFPDFTELEPSTPTFNIPAVLNRIREEIREGESLHDYNIATNMSLALTEDGLHPTADGHKALGQNLVRQLGPFLKMEGIKTIFDDRPR